MPKKKQNPTALQAYKYGRCCSREREGDKEVVGRSATILETETEDSSFVTDAVARKCRGILFVQFLVFFYI